MNIILEKNVIDELKKKNTLNTVLIVQIMKKEIFKLNTVSLSVEMESD
jgi:hypothetical protein